MIFWMEFCVLCDWFVFVYIFKLVVYMISLKRLKMCSVLLIEDLIGFYDREWVKREGCEL